MTVQGVAVAAALAVQFPAVFEHVRIHHGDTDEIVEILQSAKDQRAVCPGAGEGDIEVIASGLRLEAAFTAWARSTVGRDPVTEL